MIHGAREWTHPHLGGKAVLGTGCPEGALPAHPHEARTGNGTSQLGGLGWKSERLREVEDQSRAGGF